MSIALLTFGLLAGCSSEGYDEEPTNSNLPEAPSEESSVPDDQPDEPTDGEKDQDSTETDPSESD